MKVLGGDEVVMVMRSVRSAALDFGHEWFLCIVGLDICMIVSAFERQREVNRLMNDEGH